MKTITMRENTTDYLARLELSILNNRKECIAIQLNTQFGLLVEALDLETVRIVMIKNNQFLYGFNDEGVLDFGWNQLSKTLNFAKQQKLKLNQFLYVLKQNAMKRGDEYDNPITFISWIKNA